MYLGGVLSHPRRYQIDVSVTDVDVFHIPSFIQFATRYSQPCTPTTTHLVSVVGIHGVRARTHYPESHQYHHHSAWYEVQVHDWNEFEY